MMAGELKLNLSLAQQSALKEGLYLLSHDDSVPDNLNAEMHAIWKDIREHLQSGKSFDIVLNNNTDNLTDRDEYMILDAIKTVGLNDAYDYMFENILVSNAAEIKAFMDYVVEYDLPMGSATIQHWWAEFRVNPNEAPAIPEEWRH